MSTLAPTNILDKGDGRLGDKLWRLNHLYKIKNIDKQLIKFNMNRAQQKFHEEKHTRNIILKSRKLGFTTYFSVDALDDCLYKRNTDALMLSYDIPSQLDIFDDKVKLAWENFHEDLQGLYSLDAERANKLKWNWGDKSATSLTVRLHGRSGTYHKLHISEFGKICKTDPSAAKEIVSGTIQAVPLSGEVNIESTAEGDYGRFFDMFMEAHKRGAPRTPVDFKAFFFNWTYDDGELEKIVPFTEESLAEMEDGKYFLDYRVQHALSLKEITYYYYKWLTLGRDYKLLHREYPTTVEEAFEAAGDKFFDEASVDFLQTEDSKETTGNWKWYADYKPGHRYAMGVDPSEGIGQANATCVVWDFDWKDKQGVPKPRVVGVYADDRTKPDELAHVAKAGAVRFGNCLIAVERNNHGHTTLAILKGIYYNIYKERRTGEDQEKETEKLGWHSNSGTKGPILHELRGALIEKSVLIPDADLKGELGSFPSEEVTTFTKDEDGKHWDRVMAAAIGFYMKKFASHMGSIILSGDGGAFDKFGMFNSLD